MKFFKRLLWLTPVAIVVACSSMIPEDSKEDLLPNDFVLSEYLELNPDLASFQVQAKIKSNNAELLTTGAVSKEDSTDLKAFFADAAVLQELYELLGYDSYKKWTTLEEMAKINVPRTYVGGVYSESKVNLFTLVLEPFNSLDKTPEEDLSFVKNFEVDSTLIELQYSFYGEIEGRPYRYCKADENEIVRDEADPEQAFVNAKGAPDFRPNRYCKDTVSGTVYLIK
ncbi:MAG TPA: hypothetical protein GX724_05870 [Fibrobacter sp.]|nr:hypothetical protein [Fibrobacter sp.]